MLMLALLFRWDASAADVPIRDGGINPANLGKGDWIWHVSWATNKLGGVAQSVVNFPTLMSYYKSQGLQYIIVKAGTGSTNFFGDKHSAPQFNSNLVYHAHAAGMLIFAYTRSYDDDVQGEIDMAARCFALGADGWVIDAEAEWESGSSQAGTNGPTRAIQYGQGLRALFPTKFIAHAPFPIISFHSSFPYKEFGYFCDAVMPQAYWTEIYDEDTQAASKMFTAMDNEYRNWQNSLTGVWTNAIKPLAPIAQAWTSTSGVTTGAEIDEFFDRCRTNPNPASVTGYKGMSYWRADTKTSDMWDAIRTNVLGDVPGVPNLTMQPQNRTTVIGTNVTFTAWGTGSKPFYYRWRFNGASLPGATSPNLSLTNLQLSHSGAYSVVVSNVSGVTTSAVAMLNVTAPSTLFNVAVIPGGRSAIITWRSTNAADSQVEFGLTPSYGLATQRDLQLVTNHAVLLSGLEPGTSYFFGVISRVGGNTYRSDGGSFATAGEMVMDNTEAGFTGNWLSGNSSPDKYGSDYRYITNAPGGNTASAIYTPEIGVPGNYDVYVWYPQGGNRSTNTPVAIFYNGGTASVRINQETGGGGWRLVSSNLSFRSGSSGFVRIGNGTGESPGQVVMADAVRFVYRADQEIPNGEAVPDWWAFHYFGSNVNAQADHDGDGYADWAEYLTGTIPTDAASNVRFDLQLQDPTTLRAGFTPYVPGRRYQVERRSDGSSWETLTNLAVTVGPNGGAWITLTNTFEPLNLYRLRIDWAP